jgi:hypothetical protein
MPFENSIAHAFTALSIRAHAPAMGGVYGISNAREWLYIGQSENIQSTLMNHLQERDSLLVRSSPTGFVYEVSWPERQSERCSRLIREYAPTCNQGGFETRSAVQNRFPKERR